MKSFDAVSFFASVNLFIMAKSLYNLVKHAGGLLYTLNLIIILYTKFHNFAMSWNDYDWKCPESEHIWMLF